MKGMTGLKSMVFAGVLAYSFAAAAYAGAADNQPTDDNAITMGTVVVTGTRTQEEIGKVPANVTVITKKEIENSNAKDIVDILNYQTGITVRDIYGNGKEAQVDLRGFGETAPFNTLVLVDGRRVNEIDLSGVDWTQIPLEQIERIEIVRGTGTVLYGDNAVGGVINIITKMPAKKPAFHAGTILGSYGRNKEAVSLSGGHDNIAASLYASYDSTRGYRENSALRAKDLGGKIVLDPTEILRLTVSGSHHSDRFGLPGSLTKEQVNADRRSSNDPLDHASTIDNYAMLGMDLDLADFGKIDADLSHRNRNSDTYFVSSSYKADSTTKTTAFTPRYVWNGEPAGHKNTFVTGVDFYWSDMDVNSFFGPTLSPSDVSQVTRESRGIYFNDEFSLLKPLVFSFGARHERVDYDLRKTDLTGFLSPLNAEVGDSADAYTAGLTYSYQGESSVFLRANSSFRFPLTDELVVYDYINGRLDINSGLKPQKGKDYEIGIRHYFSKRVYLSLTLFRAEIDDEIFFNPSTYANENYPKTLHRGAEAAAKAGITRFITLFGNYTYERATFEKEPFHGNDIPAVPRNKANAGIRVHDFVPGVILSATYHFIGSSYAISDQANQYEKVGEYYTLDSRLSYKWKDLQVYFGVNNLTNRKYSQYAAIGGFPVGQQFYPAPERNWVAGINWRY